MARAGGAPGSDGGAGICRQLTFVSDGVDRLGDSLAEPVQRLGAGPGRRRVASRLTRLPLMAERGGHGADM